MTFVEAQRDSGRRWVVDGDIKDCFERIDHRLLLNMLARDLHDERLLRLIAQWPTARVFNEMPQQKKKWARFKAE